MNIYLLAVLGILLGISLAGPPGPVTAILVNRASRSIWKGILVGLGAMSADFILMVVILVFGQVANVSRFDQYIYILGSIFFFYLAIIIFRSSDEGEEYNGRDRSGYLAGLSIGVLNPMQIGWWFTAGLSVFQQFGYITMGFLFLGLIVWVVFISALIYEASEKYGSRVKYAIKLFSVLSLVFFGILFAYLSVSGIISSL